MFTLPGKDLLLYILQDRQLFCFSTLAMPTSDSRTPRPELWGKNFSSFYPGRSGREGTHFCVLAAYISTQRGNGHENRLKPLCNGKFIPLWPWTHQPSREIHGRVSVRFASALSGLVTWLLDEKLDKSAQGLKRDVIIWRLERKIPNL